MTWPNRFKLLGGFVVITIVMCALTLLFNQRQAQVASMTAVVEAPTASVGSGYGGVVIEQQVVAGQEVKAGQELFVVASPQLLNDISNGFEPVSTEAYRVDITSGTISYRAVISGQVQEVAASNGSYLQPGASLATIASDSPKTVLATFELQPGDYDRVEEGTAVTLNLADNQQLSGTATDISVTTEADRVLTTVRVESPELTDPRYESLTRVGAPTQAILSLRQDGPLAGPAAAVEQFLVKIGLR
ncbi:MAG: HlyD family efflux transporter periplasmic adaptor subunit [Propioniciclava sp.]